MNIPKRKLMLPAAVLLASFVCTAFAGDKPATPEQLIEQTNSFYQQQQQGADAAANDHRDAQIDRQRLEQTQSTARRLVNTGLPRNQLDIAPRSQIFVACETECRKMGYEAAQCTEWCSRAN